MTTIDQVEKLREKANVSYAEAKEALEKCDNDLLDAILYLEAQGKVQPPKNKGRYTTEHMAEATDHGEAGSKHCRHKHHGEYEKKACFGDLWSKFWAWTRKMMHKGCTNTFEVYRHDQLVFKMPVIVFILFLLCAFWVTVPLLVVGMFFGFKYLFGGPDLGKTDLNKVMDAAVDAAQNVKNEFKAAAENHENHQHEKGQE